MKMPPFSYVKARDLSDTFRLLKEAGDEARVLAGGQTLLATLAFRLSEPSVLIDITGVAALKGMTETADTIRIGALTTHADLGSHAIIAKYAPLFAEAVPLIAHTAIRNRGTIGGSLAYADPAAELPACVVALDAVIVVASETGERRVPASAFFTGLLSTALEEGELIVAIEVPKAARRSTIMEIARRSGDYAMAGLAMTLSATLDDRRLVFFGVGDGPMRAKQAEAALAKGVAAAQAALADDLDPPNDMHGSSAMKMQLCRTLLARSVARFTSSGKTAA